MPSQTKLDQAALRNFQSILDETSAIEAIVDRTISRAAKTGLVKNGGLPALLSAKAILNSQDRKTVTVKATLKRYTKPPQSIKLSPGAHKGIQPKIKTALKSVEKLNAKSKKCIADISALEKQADGCRKSLLTLVAEIGAQSKALKVHKKNIWKCRVLLGKVDEETPDLRGVLVQAKKIPGSVAALEKIGQQAKKMAKTKLPGLKEASNNLDKVCENLRSQALGDALVGTLIVESIGMLDDSIGSKKEKKAIKDVKAEVEKRAARLEVVSEISGHLEKLAELSELLGG